MAGSITSSAGRTDVGLVRQRNEDAILLRDDIGLWVVADGLGGHAEGDYASTLIVERLAALQRTTGGLPDFVDRIEACLEQVNRELRIAAERKKVGLIGSTVVLLVDSPSFLLCGWMGDSRCYRFDGERLEQVTTDHVIEAYRMQPPANPPLTRAVGADRGIHADWTVVPKNEGARFLLCSDGINKEMSDTELENEFRANAEPARVLDRLFDQVLERRARDNASAIILAFDGAAAKQRTPDSNPPTGEPVASPVATVNDELRHLAEAYRSGQIGCERYRMVRRELLGDDHPKPAVAPAPALRSRELYFWRAVTVALLAVAVIVLIAIVSSG